MSIHTVVAVIVVVPRLSFRADATPTQICSWLGPLTMIISVARDVFLKPATGSRLLNVVCWRWLLPASTLCSWLDDIISVDPLLYWNVFSIIELGCRRSEW